MAFRIKRWQVALVIACVTACSMAEEHGAPILDAAQLSESAPASAGEFLQLDAAKKAIKKKVSKKSKPQKLKTLAPSGVAKVPSGTFPTEQLKKKAERIEREYLARKKVISDKKEAKWQKQVLKVKVDKLATKIIKKNKKKLIKNLKQSKKVRDTRKKAYKSKLKAHKDKKKAQGLVKDRQFSIERREKANVAIASGEKMIAKIKDEKGKEAHRDKKTAYAMLAKLRIAHAHADGTIIGLTKRQRTRPCLVSLHAAVKLAAGDPTKAHLLDAKRQLKKVAECEKQERKKKIRIAKAKVRKEKATKKRREKASKEVAKKVKEMNSKKGIEKAGKKKERWADVELPTKMRKEKAVKTIDNEKRSKWLAKEEVKTKAYGKKMEGITKAFIKNEKARKKEKKVKKELAAKRCKKLEASKLNIMELRQKALANYSSARAKLVAAAKGERLRLGASSGTGSETNEVAAAGFWRRRRRRRYQRRRRWWGSAGERAAKARAKKAHAAHAAANAARAKKAAAQTALVGKYTTLVKSKLARLRERNTKLSRASSNARHCEKHLARRRRTCICTARRRRWWARRRRWWARRRRWWSRRRRWWYRRRRRVVTSLLQTKAGSTEGKGENDRMNAPVKQAKDENDRMNDRRPEEDEKRARDEFNKVSDDDKHKDMGSSADSKDKSRSRARGKAGWGRRRRRWTRRRWTRRRWFNRRRWDRRRRYYYNYRRRRTWVPPRICKCRI